MLIHADRGFAGASDAGAPVPCLFSVLSAFSAPLGLFPVPDAGNVARCGRALAEAAPLAGNHAPGQSFCALRGAASPARLYSMARTGGGEASSGGGEFPRVFPISGHGETGGRMFAPQAPESGRADGRAMAAAAPRRTASRGGQGLKVPFGGMLPPADPDGHGLADGEPARPMPAGPAWAGQMDPLDDDSFWLAQGPDYCDPEETLFFGRMDEGEDRPAQARGHADMEEWPDCFRHSLTAGWDCGESCRREECGPVEEAACGLPEEARPGAHSARAR